MRSITGWETSLWELMKAGERAINLIRCFNVREGFTKEDDTLPKRFFEELKGGPFEGQKIPKEDFERARDTFYSMMGWDTKTGIPQRAKLEELDIGWVSDILEKTPV